MKFNVYSDFKRNRRENKYFSLLFIFLLVLVIYIYDIENPITSQQKWCWTRHMGNEPGFILNESLGGINWGFCKENDGDENSNKVMISYVIGIETSSLPGSGTSSIVKLVMYSDIGTSPPITLTTQCDLSQGVYKQITVTAESLGIIKKIKIFVEGSDPFRPKSIEIISISGRFMFEFSELIMPCGISCGVEVEANGPTPYEISIKTDDNSESATKAIILVALVGSEGFTQYKLFAQSGMKAGQVKTKTFMMNDIGNVTGYKLQLGSPGKWRPSYIMIENKLNGKVVTFNFNNVVLISPGALSVYVEIHQTGGASQGGNSNGGGIGLDPLIDLSDNDDNKNIDPNDPNTLLDNDPNISYDVNNPFGGLLNPNEKKNIYELTCDQLLINPESGASIFGPDLPTSNMNYVNVLAKCPHNCHLFSWRIYGQGIHPMQSPICPSAIYDRAVSIYGGIISISIYPGMTKYLLNPKLSRKMGDIEVSSYDAPAKKSYTVAKVDNVDLVNSDFRILNSKGEFSNTGRFEYRKDGVWGTICITGSNYQSAIVICKQMGYKFGEWKNLPLTNAKDNLVGYCKSYNGGNHCGASFQAIHYSEIDCTPNDTVFDFCNKKIADLNDCTHEMDAIINCTNDTYANSGNQIPDGVVRFGARKLIDKYIMAGRVEMMNNEFMPICSRDVNWMAIQVFCRTLGYYVGDFVSDLELLKELQLEENSSVGFSATTVKCNGLEKNIKQCTTRNQPDQCKHDMDLVIKCVGKSGDPTGESQWKNKVIPKPELGKLTMPNYDVNCFTPGNHPYFRGDPGSVYLVKCPKLCGKTKGNITGTGTYSSDSPVCKAAVHAGLLNDKTGGFVMFVRNFGQTNYEGTLANGLQSQSSGLPTLASFTFTSLNSAYIRMNLLYKQFSLPIPNPMYKSYQFMRNSSFLEVSEQMEGFNLKSALKSGVKSVVKGAKKLAKSVGKAITNLFKDKPKDKSDSYIPDPVFKFFPPTIDYKFTNNNNFLLEIKPIQKLNKYTILTSFKMTYFNSQKQFIFSYPGCGGFNIYIEQDNNLVIGDPCNTTTSFNSEISLPTDDKVFVYFAYDNGKIRLIVKTEKTKMSIQKKAIKYMRLGEGSDIGIGRLGKAKQNNFNGYIDYVMVFDGEISLKKVTGVINSIIKQNQSSKAPTPLSQSVDNRMCVSPCLESRTPPSEEAGVPPKEALIDLGIIQEEPPLPGQNGSCSQSSGAGGVNSSVNISINSSTSSTSSSDSSMSSSAISNSNSDTQNSNSGSSSGSSSSRSSSSSSSPFSKYNKGGLLSKLAKMTNTQISANTSSIYSTRDISQARNIETMSIDCDTTLKDSRFNPTPGIIIRVKCPSCNSSKAAIFGTEIFHPFSSICKAASHIGVLTGGGEALVVITSGRKVFNGSTGRNGSGSGTFGSSSYSFTIKPAPSIMNLSCRQTADSGLFAMAPVFTRFVVRCPAGCSTIGDVYGSDIYADSSSICAAAIHFGVLNDKGGEADFIIEAGSTFFKGNSAFGILSKAKEGNVRAFRFIGEKSAIFFNFKEDFKGRIIDKWVINRNNQADFLVSDSWTYSEVIDNSISMGKKLNAIYHFGKIAVTTEDDRTRYFGSIIKLRNAEWSNGKISFNFISNDKNPIGIYFRYTNQENTYGIIFDFSKRINNVKLISIIDSNYRLIDTKSFPLMLGKTYMGKILVDYNNVKFNLRSYGVNDTKYIFNKQLDLGLARGTLAFATFGNRSFYITGVEVVPYSPNTKYEFINNRRSWNEILLNNSYSHRKRWCKKIFTKNEREKGKCIEEHNYCRLRCDDWIPAVENILAFQCYQECWKKIKETEGGGENTYSPGSRNIWIPFEGEKVDLIRPGEKFPVPAKIITVGGEKKSSLISLEYTSSLGATLYTSVTIDLTKDNAFLFQCGHKLTKRTDCALKD